MTEQYNILESGIKSIGFGAAGLIPISIGFIVIHYMKKYNASQFKIVFMYFWTAFAILWTVCVLWLTGQDYYELRSIYKDGNYEQVEGIVENFDPMPYGGHQDETFTVNGVRFSYSDFGVTSGFNNTKSHSGPIDEGKYVKIKYHEGVILELQIRE